MREGERGQRAERNLPLGGEHTMQRADDVLQSCTPETCMVVLINFTSINSIIKKIKMYGWVHTDEKS